MNIDYSQATTARAAELVQWLAYPLASQQEERDVLEYALYVEHLRQKADRDPEWEHMPQNLWPAPLLFDQKPLNRSLMMLKRRLSERAAAGRMAMAFVKEYYEQHQFKYPEGVTGLSIDQLAKLVMADTGETNPNNVENRIWRSSLPVLHVAAAAQMTLTVLEQRKSPYTSVGLFAVFHDLEYLLIWESHILLCQHALTLGCAKIPSQKLIQLGANSALGSKN